MFSAIIFIKTSNSVFVGAWSYGLRKDNFLLFLRSNFDGVSEEIVTSSVIAIKFFA
jgi:hypothetical protein